MKYLKMKKLQNIKKTMLLVGFLLLFIGLVWIYIYEKKIDYEDCFEFESGRITKFKPESCGWEKWKNNEIVIPNKINGKIVKSIGIVDANLHNIENWVFENLEWVSVNIPDTINKIDIWAFYNANLESIEIPNSVTEIGLIAFAWNNLKSVNIPNSVNRLGYAAFISNDLESITLSKNLSYINHYGFAWNKLGSINILNSVERIGSNAFRDNKLESVEIPDSVKEIAWRAFWENEITKVRMPENMKISNVMWGIFDEEIEFGLRYVKWGRKEWVYIRDNPESLEWRFEWSNE